MAVLDIYYGGGYQSFGKYMTFTHMGGDAPTNGVLEDEVDAAGEAVIHEVSDSLRILAPTEERAIQIFFNEFWGTDVIPEMWEGQKELRLRITEWLRGSSEELHFVDPFAEEVDGLHVPDWAK